MLYMNLNATLISWTHYIRNFKLVFRRMCPMKNNKNGNRYNDCKILLRDYNYMLNFRTRNQVDKP